MLRQALHHHPLEPPGQLRSPLAERGRGLLHVHARQLEPVARRERHLTRRRLEERDAEGVEVHARVERATLGLLGGQVLRSEEHTSELQSRFDLVCRLLLEKKKRISTIIMAGW